MTENRKILPIGVEDFEKIIKEGYYYVDKTGMIADLLRNPGAVNLFTRPRRFGKSLNMSMLEAFFDPGTDKRIFDGLDISREKALCETYMGKYPVLSISLKGIDAGNFETAFGLAVQIVNEAAYKVYPVLKDSLQLLAEERQLAAGLLRADLSEAELTGSLRVLTRLLHKHYGQKVIVLIDEYDVPLAKAHEHGYYASMVLLMRNLFQQVLKTNSSLQFAVLTGCMRISRESIFTGLNNLKVLGIADVRFDEYFGFTDQEVRDLLAYYGLSEKYDEVRDWYDGYRFGSVQIYCPWDVINYCDLLRFNPNAFPENYWSNSSSNQAVRKFLEYSSNATIQAEIERLINGDAIEKTISQELTYEEMYDSVENVWSLLFTTGYLTQEEQLDGRRFRLVIPNQEIRSIYSDQIMSLFKEDVQKDAKTLRLFCNALKAGDASGLEKTFSDYLRRTISIRDTAAHKVRKENFYHGILLGILSMVDGWGVASNRESGLGYSDIVVRSNDFSFAALLEIKYAEEGRLDAACREALRQIEERQYANDLYEEGFDRIIKYGVACYKKRCRVMVVE